MQSFASRIPACYAGALRKNGRKTMFFRKLLWLLFVSSLLAAAPMAAQDDAAAQASRYGREGTEAAAQGNWPLAEQKYRSALRLAPDSAEAMSNLGVAC